MIRSILLCLLSLMVVSSIAQPCALILLDEESGDAIQGVHVYFDDRIAVSNSEGRAELPSNQKLQAIALSLSHLAYEGLQMTVRCGDTIRMSSMILSVPEISIVSKLPKSDLKEFYRKLKSSIDKLAKVEGKGIAENTVHLKNKIGEYKSFIFNYEQFDHGINDVACINAYQHIRTDTIRYFENIHRLLECVQLGRKKRNYESLLHDFLFKRKTWNFEMKADFDDDRSYYKFSRNAEEVAVEFKGGLLSELTLINPGVVVDRVERNGEFSEGAQVSLKILFETQSNGEIYMEDLTATVDIESGLLSTQVCAAFEPSTPYRESIVSAMENIENEYLTYLMLNISDPLRELNKTKLPNKEQIHDFIHHVEPVSTELLLNQFGFIMLTDTSNIDTTLQFGEPIRVRPDGETFIQEYLHIQPLIALHAVVYENHMTDRLEIKLLLDPSSTRLIQFYDSYYNETWKVKQTEKIKSVAKHLTNYLASGEISQIKPSDLNDEEWGNIDVKIESMIASHLRTSLNKTFASLVSGKYQARRLNIKYY